ncbi:acyl-CoA carboxylase subunit epsilon [Tessaracoccus sp. Z1128]
MTGHLEFRGANLTEEEIAAVVAVMTASSGPEQLHSADARPTAGGWTSYYRTVRSPLVGGRDAWRTYHRM